MLRIVESWPINKLVGGIRRLQSADETAVQWLNHRYWAEHTSHMTHA